MRVHISRFCFTVLVWSVLISPASAQMNAPSPSTPENTPVKALVLEAPQPEYPESLKAHGIGGDGVFVLYVDSETGAVASVSIQKSTGVRDLDDCAVKALRRWRFKPRTISKEVRVPITFIPDGTSVNRP
jgi:periplasmic protein TonB